MSEDNNIKDSDFSLNNSLNESEESESLLENNDSNKNIFDHIDLNKIQMIILIN